MATLNKKNRLLSFDVIRVIALLFAISCHIGAFFVMNYKDTHTIEFITGNIFTQISASIPLFIMLTGALFLREEKKFNLDVFLKKSWFPLVVLTVIWTLFYGLLYGYGLPMLTHQPVSFDAFIKYLLTFKGSLYPHMWYSRMIVGMYLLIPILRLFVKKENKNYIKWIIIGAIVIQFIPGTLQMFTAGMEVTLKKFVETFYLQPLTGFVAYFLVGWYVTTFPLSKKLRRILYVLGIIAVLISVLSVQFYIDVIPGIRGYVHSGLDIVSFVWGVSIFVFFLSVLKDKINTNQFAIEASNFVYGMYIAHVLFLELFLQVLCPYTTFPIQIPIVYIIITLAFVVIFSFLIVWVTSKTRLKRIFYLK